MLDIIIRRLRAFFMMGYSRRVVRSLSNLKEDPANEDFLDQVQELIRSRSINFYKSVITHFPVVISQQEAVALSALVGRPGDEGVVRQTWKNTTANQVAQPLQYFRPTSLDELRSIIQQAGSKNCRVKAIGSGHSFSDVAVTSDFLVDTHGLNQVLPLEEELLKNTAAEAGPLFKTECGITIKDLNAKLDSAGLALTNMGGYDAQTIVGAASTSTHGSGISLGPLSSAVVSLVLISDTGKVYQIEPKDGITDPVKFKAKYPDRELKQDDKWFHSVNVGLGCMGVIYSVTLQVMEKYWLNETRRLRPWDEVKNELKEGNVLKDFRHYEVLINPYKVKDRRSCLVTQRYIDKEPTVPELLRPHRNYFADIIAQLPGTTEALVFIFDEFPHLIPRIIESGLETLEDKGVVDLSYKIFNIGGANLISAYSSEIAFPMNTYLDAVEKILEIAEHNRAVGNVYHTSPFSLRFVKGSEDYLSMQYGGDTCMIEIPMVNGTIGGKEILQRYETAMYEFSGRPHWGQMNYLTGNHGLIKSMYPMHDAWLDVFKELNASGMFDNNFTERCGFSESRFVREMKAAP